MSKINKKVANGQKNYFEHVSGARSTRKLVEIDNKCKKRNLICKILLQLGFMIKLCICDDLLFLDFLIVTRNVFLVNRLLYTF